MTQFSSGKQVNGARFADTNASVMLDLVRGLAALLVVSVHFRNMFFVDYTEALRLGGTRLLAGIYVLTSGGHQAVVIFFVLSGYLVGGSALRLMRRREWDWTSYLLHRLVRLWIVLLPGLILCWLWDSIGLRSHSLLYHGIIPNYETGNVSQLHTTRAFFGNLFFMQPMLVQAYGSDGPLWSLSYEFWYYLMFPLGLVALRREFSFRMRSLCLIAFLLFAWFVRREILPMFPVWLLGTLLTMIPAPRAGATVRGFATLLYLPLVFVFSRVRFYSPLTDDYIFAVASGLFLWVVLSARLVANKGSIFTRISRGMSRFSYTLYVVHQPLILLVASFLIGTERWLPDGKHLIAGAGVIILTLAYSHGVAALTEYRTEPVRQWVERKFTVARLAKVGDSAP